MTQAQKVGVTAFIYHKTKVLIVQRAKHEKFLPGYWEMPGGKVDFSEAPEDALKREIKEEIDLDIKVIRPYSTFSYTSDDNQRHTVDIQFMVEATGDINDIKLSKNHDDYKWIDQDELNNYQVSELMKKTILQGFKTVS